MEQQDWELLRNLCNLLKRNKLDAFDWYGYFYSKLSDAARMEASARIIVHWYPLLTNALVESKRAYGDAGTLRTLNLSRAFYIPEPARRNNRLPNLERLFPSFVTRVLMGHPSVKELCLRANQLNSNNAICLSRTLASGTAPLLVKLDLSFNYIGDSGVVNLVSGLRHSTTLEALDIRCNQIGNEGCTALASLLRIASLPLHILDLENNRICALGCTPLAMALKDKHCSLQRLVLSNNSVGNDGAGALASALEENSCPLCELALLSTKISDAGACALFNAIKLNEKLKALALFGNNIGDDEACQSMASMLRRNTALEYLDLVWNDDSSIISPDSELLIKAALYRSNYTLRLISCWGGLQGDLRGICDENHQIKMKYTLFMVQKHGMALKIWPTCLQHSGIATKAGLIYEILRHKPDEWIGLASEGKTRACLSKLSSIKTHDSCQDAT